MRCIDTDSNTIVPVASFPGTRYRLCQLLLTPRHTRSEYYPLVLAAVQLRSNGALRTLLIVALGNCNAVGLVCTAKD